ncbi:MAG: hypothetical protein K8R21_06535 [Leptospira sp.]|nr:hypothetical protein [Leptospira sp.]
MDQRLTKTQGFGNFQKPGSIVPIAFLLKRTGIFSGAVYTIFPDAKNFILIGLEPGGFVPDIENMTVKNLSAELMELSRSLDTISRLNFFKTNNMKKELGSGHFKGAVPVFLAYFGLLNLQPVQFRYFELTPDGKIHYLSEEELKKNTGFKSGLISFEFEFIDPVSHDAKKLYFLSKDLSNTGLDLNPGISKFLESFGTFAVTVKAASYLLHYERFSKFRDCLLQYAEVFVMDDTGPPLRFLTEKFEVKVFGKYTRPIRLWNTKFQNDLAKLHKIQKPEPIHFKYGYGTIDRKQHILIAKRK